ncbi:hypothetical protein [Sphingobacterium faecale]|uniref:Lipoprotein n=1 Tax=Sphingobacterium faecale TaxID=2803775 RepID=A0ABS1QY32_9SPHI|nr:hypothetical protein [Sphingobacterium faecale]MBL1407341.1 hypothetical protein [Sphingobacterium faecale]
MSRILACILLTCAFGLIVSCNPQSDASRLLRQACAIIEEHPDGALGLIGSIRHPESMSNTGIHKDKIEKENLPPSTNCN